MNIMAGFMNLTKAEGEMNDYATLIELCDCVKDAADRLRDYAVKALDDARDRRTKAEDERDGAIEKYQELVKGSKNPTRKA